MINQPASVERRVVPVHVWAELEIDHRVRAIRLMTQLAFNLVLAQSDLLVKEPKYVEPTHYPQDPTRTP
jgi:hypothetical protein